jgi:hypothetical protein
MNKPVKHAGCNKCGDMSQEFLTSVQLPGQGGTGSALCDSCLVKYGSKPDKKDVKK